MAANEFICSYSFHLSNSLIRMFIYQLDLRTPGSIPSFANSRKQIRQRPKSLMKAFPRPQRKHRFFARVLNFCFLAARALTDVFAINKLSGVLR
jgi:hypothetical protein